MSDEGNEKGAKEKLKDKRGDIQRDGRGGSERRRGGRNKGEENDGA